MLSIRHPQQHLFALLHRNSGWDSIRVLSGGFRAIEAITRSGDVRLAGPGVLARHATFRWQGGALALQAIGPVTVNDEPLDPRQSRFLRAGDLLRFGQSEYALVRDRG